MKTTINPVSFLLSIVQPKETQIERVFPASKNTHNLTHEVGVFDEYLDVREVLEELELAGLNLSQIKLIAGDGWRCHWLGDLNICDCFDEKLFTCDRAIQDFFQELFEQGKYLLLVTGTENELNFYRQIIERCQVCSQVWFF